MSTPPAAAPDAVVEDPDEDARDELDVDERVVDDGADDEVAEAEVLVAVEAGVLVEPPAPEVQALNNIATPAAIAIRAHLLDTVPHLSIGDRARGGTAVSR